MARINLLPWRERLREERKREFFYLTAAMVVCAVALLFLVDRYVMAEISKRMARNEFLRGEIQLLEAQVAELDELRQRKQDFQARMNVIADLQGTRPLTVRLFDELVQTLPDGVFYTRVERSGDVVVIEGVSESYTRITELLRRLDESPWFAAPDISVISAAEPVENIPSLEFSLAVNLAPARQAAGAMMITGTED